ncbi:hypothetical protein [Arthrobacter sp. MP_2.3]|uniref:hypothetical protein n=1 Tax=Arthrobacter sp. MP_2.3 TaxID=3349633 RepID=UPI0038D3A039
MERQLQPIFDDNWTEVSRDVYWGQRELAEVLGTTPMYVGDLLRLIGLLQPQSKEPSVDALSSGAAIFVTLETAQGLQRNVKWHKDLVRDDLVRAIQQHPKPLTRTEQARRDQPTGQKPPRTLPGRVEALEERVRVLEQLLAQKSEG